MAKKITVDDVIEIQRLKLKGEAAYEDYHIALQSLFEKHGEGTHSFEIEEDENGKKWIRLGIVDNSEKLKKNEKVVGISLTRRVGGKIDLLKNAPSK